MAETAKVLNPTRIVVAPDRDAGCSLVDSCKAEDVREYRRRNPDHVIVSYINTSVEVKAESDILCTSRNAVKIVNSIPRDKTVLFLPDRNLGAWVQRETGRQNMKIWQGSCIVHNTFPSRRLLEAKTDFPAALVVAHPECPEAVLRHADFIGSTSAIIEYCATSPAREFIVMTESGVNYSLERAAPGRRFHYVANENCNCSECPFMRLNTMEKLRDALTNLAPRVELAPDLMRRALAAPGAYAGSRVNAAITKSRPLLTDASAVFTIVCASVSPTAAISAVFTACPKKACSSWIAQRS